MILLIYIDYWTMMIGDLVARKFDWSSFKRR